MGYIAVLFALFAAGSSSLDALTPPPQRYALEFSRPLQSIATAPAVSSLSLGPRFTIEAWVFIERTDQYWIAGKGLAGDPFASFVIVIDTDNQAHFATSTGHPGSYVDIGSGKPIPLRTWTHLAGTLDGTMLNLYVNGVKSSSAPSPGPPPNTTTTPFTLQAGPDLAMREVRVWGRALSSGEIQGYAGKHLKGNESGLVADWPLDDGAGQTARDLGPSHLDLQLGSTPALDGDDPRWIHTITLDTGPYFALDGPNDLLPGCGDATDPCVGAMMPIVLGHASAPTVVAALGDAQFNPHPMSGFVNDGHGLLSLDAQAVFEGTPPSTIGPSDYLARDFNGDGEPDLLVVDPGNDLDGFQAGTQSRLLIQQPNGKLQDETASRLPQFNAYSFRAAAADFRGTGALDIYMSILSTHFATALNWPTILINDGTGHFTQDSSGLPELVAHEESGYHYSSVVAADFNGDGFPDLFLGKSGGQNQPHDDLLVNDGHGHFSFAPEGAVPPRPLGSNSESYDMHLGDFDGDGWPDIAQYVTLQDGSAAGIAILLNNHNGTFHYAPELLPPKEDIPAGISSFVVGDFNNDGRPDLLINVCCNRNPVLLLNSGGARFVDASELLPQALVNGPDLAVDLNGDGLLDVLQGGGGSGAYTAAFSVKPFDLSLWDPRRGLLLDGIPVATPAPVKGRGH